MIENVTPQFGAYLTMVIYDCKTFTVQPTEQGPIFQNIMDSFIIKDLLTQKILLKNNLQKILTFQLFKIHQNRR